MEDFWTSEEEDAALYDGGNFCKEVDISDEESENEFKAWDEVFKLSVLKTTAEGYNSDMPQYEDLKTFVATGEKAKEPEPTIDIPNESIRTKWVIHDTSNVTNFNEVLPKEQRAYIHPFELDDFQKRAILHVEKNEHIMVAAHTSAGKTAVAEYAVAYAAKNGLRCIYTSPIKALGNQKFREFTQQFESVGIVTGDVNVNPDAQCLLLTTEILRTMLYRGDPLIDEVSCIVFDEVHYINDNNRGLVWEECIVLVPAHVTMVMLSATASNVLQFADWIGFAKKREVFVVKTDHRPVPLEHSIVIDKERILMMDSDGFKTKAYRTYFEKKKREASEKDKAKTQGKAKGKSKAKAKPKPQFTKFANKKGEILKLNNFIKELQVEALLPCIVFVFSRKKTEEIANSMTAVDFSSKEEKSKIERFLNEALGSVDELDRDIDEINIVFDLLRRGLAIHHGGLLPVVKEAVEILFGRGLVKVLIATETFAMGVNMPARSVIFTEIKKHDGRNNRVLNPSEYIQMAGRAGRRGLDTTGKVFILAKDELPAASELNGMMLLPADGLVSKFRLTFYGLLSLSLRSNSMKPMDLIANSFSEEKRVREAPLQLKWLAQANKMLLQSQRYECIYGESTMADYVKSWAAVSNNRSNQLIDSKRYVPGRVVVMVGIENFVNVPSYGVLIGVNSAVYADSMTYTVLLVVEGDMDKKKIINLPAGIKHKYSPCLIYGTTHQEKEITGVIVYGVSRRHFDVTLESTIRVPQSFIRSDFRSVQRNFDEIIRKADPGDKTSQFQVEIPTFEMSKGFIDASIDDFAFILPELYEESLKPWEPLTREGVQGLDMDNLEMAQNLQGLMAAINTNKCHKCDFKVSHYDIEDGINNQNGIIDRCTYQLKDESLALYTELRGKRTVAIHMGYLNSQEKLTAKGRCAVELMTGDDLSIVELLFRGLLKGKTSEEIVAILATFVSPDRKKVTVREDLVGDTTRLDIALQQVSDIHEEIFDLCQVNKCVIPEDTREELQNSSVAYVAYAWAKGAKAHDLVGSGTDMQGGSIVRMMNRVVHLVHKVESAAKLMGNDELSLACQAAIPLIKRSILFCPSLYIKRKPRTTTL